MAGPTALDTSAAAIIDRPVHRLKKDRPLPLKSALIVCAALTFGLTSASAKMRRPSDEDVLQAACYPDVQRLCKDEIPNEKKITACMERKKAQISRKCTEAYERVEAGKR